MSPETVTQDQKDREHVFSVKCESWPLRDASAYPCGSGVGKDLAGRMSKQ